MTQLHTNANLFVITGGPGAGKTAVLEELAKLGFPYAPEAARQIIREQVASGGSALPWADRDAYTRLMLRRSIESFRAHTPSPAPIFADRGIPDTLAYARRIGLARIFDIEAACRCYRYASLVFAAPPWEEIYRTDAERKQDFTEAADTYRDVTTVYREHGYELVELPKTTVAERARFIAERIRSIAV